MEGSASSLAPRMCATGTVALADRRSRGILVERGGRSDCQGEFVVSAEVSALHEGELRFWRDVGTLYAIALGDAMSDRVMRATAMGLTNPATLGALRDSGLSLPESVTVVSDVMNDAIDRFEAQTRPKARRGREEHCVRPDVSIPCTMGDRTSAGAGRLGGERSPHPGVPRTQRDRSRMRQRSQRELPGPARLPGHRSGLLVRRVGQGPTEASGGRAYAAVHQRC